MGYHHQGWKRQVDLRLLPTSSLRQTITEPQKSLRSSASKMILDNHMIVQQSQTNFGLPQMHTKSLRYSYAQTMMEFIWSVPHKLGARLNRMFSLVFVLALVLVYHPASAQTNLGSVNLPQAPQFPQGQDRIRATDGTECSRSTAPRRKYMDVGVVAAGSGGTGVENQYPYTYFPGMTTPPNNQYNRTGGSVYARVVINLDANTYDIDCGRLYELEIERLKTELEQAKLFGAGKPVAK